MAKFERINLPQGGISRVAESINISRAAVSRYLSGMFDEYSKCYEEALRVREIAKNMYNL